MEQTTDIQCGCRNFPRSEAFTKLILTVLILLTVFSSILGQQPFQTWTKFGPQNQWSEWEKPWDNFKNNVVLRTYYGDVEGYSIPWHIEDEIWDPSQGEYPMWWMRRINCFLGVPYAEPPLGRLRFDKPRRPKWGGIWQATYYRNACPQTIDYIREDIPEFPKQNISEDCLYMNIFVPNVTLPDLAPDPHLYPVIVWFHSGDFSSGTAQQHPGHVLATRYVVVVTVNYRLGALGFLTTEDEHASGNWGLYDQQLALEFIKENIKKFRGDPDHITIMGDGSGGVSVGMHLISPVSRSKDFYHQAAMMSGTDLSAFGFIRPFWQPRDYAYRLGELLNCPTHHSYDMIQCLRDNKTISWQMILEKQLEISPNDGVMGVTWAPTQDAGWYNRWPYVPMTPWEIRNQDNFDKVPAIIGINTQDGAKKANMSIHGLQYGMRDDAFRHFIDEMVRGWNVLPDFHERAASAIDFQYTHWPDPSNISARAQEYINMFTDLWYGMPMDEAIKTQCDDVPTYMYRFNYKSWTDWVPKQLGVGFSAAVPYLFGHPFMNETVLNETELVVKQWYDYEERNMSDWIMYMWTNFAKYGDPTPNITRNITWDPFNRHNLSYLIIDDHSHIWFQYRQNKYSFWRDYFPRLAQADYLYPTATPTPEGYEYVIATGAMTAVLLVMFLGVGILTYMLYKPTLEDDELTIEASEPFTFQSGRSQSQASLASRGRSQYSHSVV